MANRTCLRCGELKAHEGRGLCKPCYFAEWSRGRLALYPPTRRRKSVHDWLSEIPGAGNPDICWPWPGSIDAYGYGVLRPKACSPKAHRAVYEELVGALDPDTPLDHTCHRSHDCQGGRACSHRRCVNPSHLSPSTSRANSRRSAQERPSCRSGHAWTPENTLYWRDPKSVGGRKRVCRACRDIRRTVNAERRRRRSAQRPGS